MDDYAEASCRLQEVINICASTGNEPLKTTAQKNKAEILIHFDENTAAKALLNEALDVLLVSN